MASEETEGLANLRLSAHLAGVHLTVLGLGIYTYIYTSVYIHIYAYLSVGKPSYSYADKIKHFMYI
jgi:hypothetical protein